MAGGRWQFVAGAGGRWQQVVDGRCASLLLLWQVRFIVVAVAVAFYSVV